MKQEIFLQIIGAASLTPAERLLLCWVEARRGMAHQRLSHEYIAAACGLSRVTVTNAIKNLVRRGWLIRHEVCHFDPRFGIVKDGHYWTVGKVIRKTPEGEVYVLQARP